jgi:hypothetical protein
VNRVIKISEYQPGVQGGDFLSLPMNLTDLRSCVLCVDVYVWLYVDVTGVQKGNR